MSGCYLHHAWGRLKEQFPELTDDTEATIYIGDQCKFNYVVFGKEDLIPLHKQKRTMQWLTEHKYIGSPEWGDFCKIGNAYVNRDEAGILVVIRGIKKKDRKKYTHWFLYQDITKGNLKRQTNEYISNALGWMGKSKVKKYKEAYDKAIDMFKKYEKVSK